MTRKEIARIDNRFAIDAQYKMTLVEQKILYKLISKINPETQDSFQDMELTIEEIKNALGSKGKVYKSLYSRLNNFTEKLARQVFKFDSEVEVGGEKLKGYLSFFQSVIPKYNDKGEATISFRFNDDLKPFLLHLKEYVKINQLQMAKFTSTFSIRLYTALKAMRAKRRKHEKVSREYYGLDELKTFLSVGNKYTRFADFKRRVITTIVKELNEKSDIKIIEVDYTKSRRSVTGITFVFTDQEPIPSNEKEIDVEPIKTLEIPAQITTQSEKIEQLTYPQKLVFDFLSAPQRDVNKIFILNEVIPSFKKLPEPARGWEDHYIKIIWNDLEQRSTAKKGSKLGGIFVSWWKAENSINSDRHSPKYIDELLIIKKSKSIWIDTRREIQNIPHKQGATIVQSRKGNTAEKKNDSTFTQSVIQIPEPQKKKKGAFESIGDYLGFTKKAPFHFVTFQRTEKAVYDHVCNAVENTYAAVQDDEPYKDFSDQELREEKNRAILEHCKSYFETGKFSI